MLTGFLFGGWIRIRCFLPIGSRSGIFSGVGFGSGSSSPGPAPLLITVCARPHNCQDLLLARNPSHIYITSGLENWRLCSTFNNQMGSLEDLYYLFIILRLKQIIRPNDIINATFKMINSNKKYLVCPYVYLLTFLWGIFVGMTKR